MFRGIKRVKPGHLLAVSNTGISERCYEQIDWTPDYGQSEQYWVDGIRQKLHESILRQKISDVPIGISLSGGIDSSTIVSMIGSSNRQETKSFTLGFQ